MGWIAIIFSVLGIILNAKKVIWCWLVWIISNLLWTIHAFALGDWSAVCLWVVFTGFNIYGWYQWIPDWRKKKQKVQYHESLPY